MPNLHAALDALAREQYALGRIDPAYDEVRGLTCAALAAPGFLPGTLLVLRSRATASPDCPALAAGVAELRARFPTVPVVAEVDALTPEALHFALCAQRLRLRAVIVRDTPPAPHLRRALTRPHRLGGDVVEWLRLRRIALSPPVAHLVRHLVVHGARPASVDALLRGAKAAPSSVRTRFRRKGLPSPACWHRMARALHVALRLQAEPRKSLLALAHECGYGDHAALSRQFTGCFALRPGEVRGTLGWEWLLDRWAGRTLAHASAERLSTVVLKTTD